MIGAGRVVTLPLLDLKISYIIVKGSTTVYKLNNYYKSVKCK